MSDRQYQIFGLRAFGQTTGLIAVPVVAFALGGRWLDGRLGTGSLFLVGIVLAFAVSAVLVWRHAKELGKEYQALVDAEKRTKAASRHSREGGNPAQNR